MRANHIIHCLIGINTSFVGIIVEWIVTGQLTGRQPETRAITRTDTAFVLPFLSAAMSEIRDVGLGTVMEGWITDEMQPGQRVADAVKLPVATTQRALVELGIQLSKH